MLGGNGASAAQQFVDERQTARAANALR